MKVCCCQEEALAQFFDKLTSCYFFLFSIDLLYLVSFPVKVQDPYLILSYSNKILKMEFQLPILFVIITFIYYYVIIS